MSTAYLSSENSDPDQQGKVLRGEMQIVFIGPELLMLNPTWRDMLMTPIYKRNLAGCFCCRRGTLCNKMVSSSF